jgi:hypothetical protein
MLCGVAIELLVDCVAFEDKMHSLTHVALLGPHTVTSCNGSSCINLVLSVSQYLLFLEFPDHLSKTTPRLRIS